MIAFRAAGKSVKNFQQRRNLPENFSGKEFRTATAFSSFVSGLRKENTTDLKGIRTNRFLSVASNCLETGLIFESSWGLMTETSIARKGALCDFWASSVQSHIPQQAPWSAKAQFLTDIMTGRITCPLISKAKAVDLLGWMQGGYNVQPLVDALELEAELAELAVKAGSEN